MSTLTPPVPFHDTEREFYGEKVIAVEPGGVEFIPLSERHGNPIQLLWTWTSPNMEFATVAVGLLGVLYWGLTFWQCVLAIVIGTALGSITHAILSTWGPKEGLCQMVLSRTGFGFLGNILPAGLNTVTAGVGWFAVNSISGALALHALISGLPKQLCLIIIVALELGIAFFGHNLVHVFERYCFPALTIIFVITAIWVLSKAHPGLAAMKTGAPPTLGGFLLMTGAAFGYAVGWNPYASDYTRYMKPDTRSLPIGLYAGLGVFLSCVLLEVAGAAVVTAGKTAFDPSSFTSLVPTWLGKLTLIAVFVGAICANVLNVYSASLSFMTLGIKLPTQRARAFAAIALGLIGYVVAIFGIKNAGSNYENFLLVIAYWIAPWLAVVFVDRWLRRGSTSLGALAQNLKYENWAGPIAMAVGAAVSIYLFANQVKYTGVVPKHHPAFGDITFEVGFVISAVLYYVLFKVLKSGVAPAAVASAPAPTAPEPVETA
jgi:NCS1 nucleoside transporter family